MTTDRREGSRAIDVVMAHPNDMLPSLCDRDYARYRRDYWKHKMEQADDYVPLVDVLGREGDGIWV